LKQAVSTSPGEQKGLNEFTTAASKSVLKVRRKMPRRLGSRRSDLRRDAGGYLAAANLLWDGRGRVGEAARDGFGSIKKFAFNACDLQVASQH
jgi:hypothetical protein